MTFEFSFLPIVQVAGDKFEPFIHACLRGKSLFNIPRFVDEVEDHAIFHAFAEFVGVDIFAEDFEAGLFVFLQQGRAREANKDRVGHDGFHGAVQFAALGAVTFIHKDEDFTDGFAGLGVEFLD